MYSVVIVEDDPAYQTILMNLVDEDERLNLVETIDDSLRAVLKVNKHKPDILLLDINISGLDGFDLFDILDFKPNTIVVSGDEKNGAEAKRLGLSGFIHKPFKNNNEFKKQVDFCIRNLEG